MALHAGTGKGPGHQNRHVQGGGLPALTFAPAATRIHPETYIKSTQLGTTDTSFGILSFDFKGICGLQSNPGNDGNFNVHNKEIVTTLFPGYQSEGVQGLNIAIDNAGGNAGSLRVNFADHVGNAILCSVPGFLADKNGVFGNLTILWSLAIPGSRFVNILWNGVQQTVGYTEYAGSVPDNIPGNPPASGPAPISATFVPYIFANARGFGIGQDGVSGAPNKNSFDIGRFLLDTHTSDVLAANAGVAPASFIQKIWNDGPMNLGVGGANLFGTQLDVFHEGDHTGFMTEQGSNTATWSLASPETSWGNTPVLYDASFGVAGPQGSNPACLWSVGDSPGAVASFDVDNRGCGIALNDQLVLLVITVNASNLDNGIAIASTGWAIPSHSGSAMPVVNASSGGRPNNVVAYAKRATAADVTAPGHAWGNIGGGAAPHVTMSIAPGRCTYLLLNYGHCGGIDDMSVAISSPNPSILLTLPSVIASVPNTRLICAIGYYETKDYGQTLLPANQNLISKRPNDQTSVAFFQVSDEAISAAGSVGTRICTASGFTSGNSGAAVCISMLLKP